jgi:histidinol phosphatase-like PHP family hydrolase
VAVLARKYGAKMVIDSDAHGPDDLMDEEKAYKVALGAGLTKAEADAAIQKIPFEALRKI